MLFFIRTKRFEGLILTKLFIIWSWILLWCSSFNPNYIRTTSWSPGAWFFQIQGELSYSMIFYRYISLTNFKTIFRLLCKVIDNLEKKTYRKIFQNGFLGVWAGFFPIVTWNLFIFYLIQFVKKEFYLN